MPENGSLALPLIGSQWLKPSGISCFCGDLPEEEQQLVYATHYAPAADLFLHNAPGISWRSKPSWCIVADNQTVHPDLERASAKRKGRNRWHPSRRPAASMVDSGQVNQVHRPVACRYVAAVPELSAGLPPIPGLPWESLSHRQVLAELTAGGWVPCGVGDWAVALRSPEGTVVARVCPFDPAYWAFVDLCRECAGNRWLPRIELAADLEGGGSVVFLEFAAPVDEAVAGQVAGQWRTAAGDAEFGEVRRAAQLIDAGYRKSTPWWGRCDLNEAHIRRAADGRLVLIDVFCMDGASLYREILQDVAGVHRRIPRERMRYALDIPYIARENSTAEILALRKAWARAAG